MRDCLESRISFIHDELKIKGRSYSKKDIRALGAGFINRTIDKFNDDYRNYLNTQIYVISAKKDGRRCSCDKVITADINQVVDKFTCEGYEDIHYESAETHHICKYCGSITPGKTKDLLCHDCIEIFGHRRYSDL